MDFYSNNLYIYADEEGFVMVESVGQIDVMHFYAIILETTYDDFKDLVGRKAILSTMAFELIVSDKQLNQII